MGNKITTSCRTDKPRLAINMISHGTLLSVNLQESRRFYEEVLGFEVLQMSGYSMLVRLGTDHTYVVVETGQLSTMPVVGHNGLHVSTREDVEKAHEILTDVKDEYRIRRILKVLDQHGVYSFYFHDLDSNWWEITTGNPRGYAYAFDEPWRDITDRTDIDPDGMQHVLDDEFAEQLRASAT